MKNIIIILLLLTPLFTEAQVKDSKPETKKEVVYKKSNDLISTDFYIKSLKLKRNKSIKC